MKKFSYVDHILCILVAVVITTTMVVEGLTTGNMIIYLVGSLMFASNLATKIDKSLRDQVCFVITSFLWPLFSLIISVACIYVTIRDNRRKTARRINLVSSNYSKDNPNVNGHTFIHNLYIDKLEEAIKSGKLKVYDLPITPKNLDQLPYAVVESMKYDDKSDTLTMTAILTENAPPIMESYALTDGYLTVYGNVNCKMYRSDADDGIMAAPVEFTSLYITGIGSIDKSK